MYLDGLLGAIQLFLYHSESSLAEDRSVQYMKFFALRIFIKLVNAQISLQYYIGLKFYYNEKLMLVNLKKRKKTNVQSSPLSLKQKALCS